MTHPLQLEPSSPGAKNESPAAWFLPGANPEWWLSECVRCGMANSMTRLYFVPRSIADPALLGVLIVPGKPNSEQSPPPVGMPCRRIEGRLYVPLESRFTPGLLAGELARLCPHETAFLHPTAGLSGFETRSARAVWDLLELPEERPEPWNSAIAGESCLPTFAGIQFQVEPDPQEIFGETSTAIGTTPPAALPPAPNEPASHPVAQAGRTLRKSLAKRLSDLLDRLPKTASKPTWVDTVRGWADTQAALSESQLEQIRNQELHRLMALLKRDPDAGLRHAIPIKNDPGRGKAPPSARLENRTPRFDASRLRSGPVDSWNVPEDLLASLRQRYLELANQELQLGRYQRAAYIHANLLGDLSTAANILKQGRHFREAALVFEHHLNNPTEAGECYALASLHEDAIRVWTPIGLWERVAQLHEGLGQHDAALEAWRKSAAGKQSIGDVVGAARILDAKLHQPDTALALLFSTWHASPKAFEPVSEAFQMLGSKGRHTDAMERLEWILSSPRLAETDHRVTDFLVALALRYPEPLLRKRASDESLIQLSRLLSQHPLNDPSAAKASEAVSRLWPEDPIFERDCKRFLATAREQALLKQRQSPTRPRPSATGKALVGQFSLPSTVRWLHLQNVGIGFQALGSNASQVWVTRGNWSGESQSMSWPLPSETSGIELFHGFSAELAAFGALGLPPFPVRNFPESAALGWSCSAGTPSWLPSLTLAMLRTDSVYVILYIQAMSVKAGSYTFSGRAGAQRELFPFANFPEEVSRFPTQKLVAIDSGFAIGLGPNLWLGRAGKLEHLPLKDPILFMIPTRPFTRPGLVVIHQRGCQLRWLGSSECLEIDTEFDVSFGALVAPNWLVLSSATEAQCYTIEPGQLVEHSRWKWESMKVAAITPTGNPHELAVLDLSGQVKVFRL